MYLFCLYSFLYLNMLCSFSFHHFILSDGGSVKIQPGGRSQNYVVIQREMRNRVSSVGIVTGCRLDGWGSIFGKSKRFSSSSQGPDWLRCPPSILFNGYRCSFSGVKRPGREADYSSPTSAKVNDGGGIPFTERNLLLVRVILNKVTLLSACFA
jgi:hypothetical protein